MRPPSIADAGCLNAKKILQKNLNVYQKRTQVTLCIGDGMAIAPRMKWWFLIGPNDNMIASDMGQCKVRFLLSSQMKGLIFCVIVQKLGKVLGFSKPLSPFIWVLPFHSRYVAAL